MPENNVVFDVYLRRRTSENEVAWEVKLLEINPYFNLTDPCLYNWHKKQEFDGSLKIIEA